MASISANFTSASELANGLIFRLHSPPCGFLASQSAGCTNAAKFQPCLLTRSLKPTLHQDQLSAMAFRYLHISVAPCTQSKACSPLKGSDAGPLSFQPENGVLLLGLLHSRCLQLPLFIKNFINQQASELPKCATIIPNLCLCLQLPSSVGCLPLLLHGAPPDMLSAARGATLIICTCRPGFSSAHHPRRVVPALRLFVQPRQTALSH